MTQIFGSGVEGPDALLHTIELRCEAAPSDDWIKATLGSDGFVMDMNNFQYTDVTDADGIIHQTAAAAIPTLNEWGLIIFMTLMMGVGVMILRKRRIA